MTSKILLNVLLAIAPCALAMPTVFHTNDMSPAPQSLLRRQTPIPDDYLYVVEWYPEGCGNGDQELLYGVDGNLAVCQKFNGLSDPVPSEQSAVRFTFPEDDTRTFKWRLFESNDCSTQIATGDGPGCFTVPSTQQIGEVIVYT